MISALIVFSIVIMFRTCDCKGPLAPAPAGIHGTYSMEDDMIYLIKLDRDSLVRILNSGRLTAKPTMPKDYDPPWDSARFTLQNIMCENESVGADIELKSDKQNQTTLEVFWFNASPTDDDKEYTLRAIGYRRCFEANLRGLGVPLLAEYH
ncbi:MAG: hypothetical protein H7Y31_00060 [Chitinophagaceae bacterium]|nr:hypothetical protein [Chitinophagaceae bacterium]